MSADKEPQAVAIIHVGGYAWAVPTAHSESLMRFCATIAACGVAVDRDYEADFTEWRKADPLAPPHIHFANHILPAKIASEKEVTND
tara:strand:+ start:56 stop:316 length:261 start_codon:yes stop_codon:yes gene_type:complete